MNQPILKSFKFRINPNEEQKVLLNKHFGCVRFCFNSFFNQKKEELNNSSAGTADYERGEEIRPIRAQARIGKHFDETFKILD